MTFLKKLKPFHTDERGTMTYLFDEEVKITSALIISSKKGAIRANHYHKKDSHYAYMLKGKMEYTYQVLNLKSKRRKTLVVKEGEIVYTPPMVVHAMKFLEDSVFLALTTEKRDRKKYEKDTVRIKLV